MKALDLLIHIKPNKDWTESISVGLRLAAQLDARAHAMLTLGELARTKVLFAKKTALIAERQADWDRRIPAIEARFRKALERELISHSGVALDLAFGARFISPILTDQARVHLRAECTQ